MQKSTIMTIITSVCIFTLCFVGQVKADDLHVPEQYDTISKAIENSFPGDNIVIAAGTYDEQIVLNTGANIIGAGVGVTIITASTDPIISVSLIGPLTIKGVTIDGKNAEVTGMSFTNKSLASIKDVVVKNVGKDGIVCDNNSDTNISDVVVTNVGNIGISCKNGSSPIITNVTIAYAGGDGVSCVLGSSPILSDCIIKRAKSNGISFGTLANEYSTPKIRRCLIIENRMDGVRNNHTGYKATPNPNLGTQDDPGENEIFNNGLFAVNNLASSREVRAMGNWWGQENPPAQFFNGRVQITPTLAAPPLSKRPIITSISPNAGSIEGGTLIKITGSQFTEGATVEVGGKEATSVTVDSDTQITAVTPAGKFGLHNVVVKNPEGNFATLPASFAYIPTESEGMREFDLSLTKGVNLISLPLRPDSVYTASTLASEISATIVIRSYEGEFQVYVPDGGFGIDFSLEAGRGYIINLLKDTTFSLTGRAWGTTVPAAPSVRHTGTALTTEAWAFAIAGTLADEVPKEASILITNHRTGQSIVAHIDASGRFTTAFVDMNKRSVVAVGDEISLQILDSDGFRIGQPKRHRITSEQLARAYLLSTLNATPTQTRLLPNYPNPFNPETWIPYQLASDSAVAISIFNVNGQLTRIIALGRQAAGMHISQNKAAYWNGTDRLGAKVASGVYFYTLQAGEFRATRRMLVVK